MILRNALFVSAYATAGWSSNHNSRRAGHSAEQENGARLLHSASAMARMMRSRSRCGRPFSVNNPNTLMQRITREQARKYAFDWKDEPLLRVRQGETFEIETYDASTGYFKSP